MRKFIELIPFPLLIIGTLGLLLNEFVFDWGRTATIIFASANVLGLLALGISRFTHQRGQTLN
jgi:hypothetical protein